jgi:hypothetical protein
LRALQGYDANLDATSHPVNASPDSAPERNTGLLASAILGHQRVRLLAQ